MTICVLLSPLLIIFFMYLIAKEIIRECIQSIKDRCNGTYKYNYAERVAKEKWEKANGGLNAFHNYSYEWRKAHNLGTNDQLPPQEYEDLKDEWMEYHEPYRILREFKKKWGKK